MDRILLGGYERRVLMPEDDLKRIKELEDNGTVDGKKPVEVIREMNPGADIPSGAELAGRLSGSKAEEE